MATTTVQSNPREKPHKHHHGRRYDNNINVRHKRRYI